MLQSGYVLGGKYEIQREVGRGGMSIVYLALDLRLRKLWAVKEVKQTGKDENGEIYISQFMQEAKMLMRLDHPALPRIVDLIDENGKKYVVMDFVEGQNLFEVMKERQKFPEDEVIEWGKQITDALSYLHRQDPPIIYRDMKPGNVMLKPDGNIKIIDFGIAREYKVGNLTDTVALGTRGYIPPEQYSGQTDPRSDIYAIGMTMHHLLTGVDPRTADAYAPVRSWDPNLSEGIELIINKCAAPAPENRYQNCEELLYDLSHPDQITRDYRKKQKSKLRTFAITAATATVMLVGGIGIQVYASVQDQNNFAEHVSMVTNSTSTDGKLQAFQEAIAVSGRKEDVQPYQAMINSLWSEDFTSKQVDEFLKAYDATSFHRNPSTSEQFDMNLRLAEYFLVDYGEGKTLRDQISKAMPYLSANEDAIQERGTDTFDNAKVSEDFYTLLNYYRDNIIADKTHMPGQEEQQDDVTPASFFDHAESIVQTQGTPGDEKLIQYSIITSILNGERAAADAFGKDPAIAERRTQLLDQISSNVVQNGASIQVDGKELSHPSAFQQKIAEQIKQNIEDTKGLEGD